MVRTMKHVISTFVVFLLLSVVAFAQYPPPLCPPHCPKPPKVESLTPVTVVSQPALKSAELIAGEKYLKQLGSRSGDFLLLAKNKASKPKRNDDEMEQDNAMCLCSTGGCTSYYRACYGKICWTMAHNDCYLPSDWVVW
jgi:hypothetical protein